MTDLAGQLRRSRGSSGNPRKCLRELSDGPLPFRPSSVRSSVDGLGLPMFRGSQQDSMFAHLTRTLSRGFRCDRAGCASLRPLDAGAHDMRGVLLRYRVASGRSGSRPRRRAICMPAGRRRGTAVGRIVLCTHPAGENVGVGTTGSAATSRSAHPRAQCRTSRRRLQATAGGFERDTSSPDTNVAAGFIPRSRHLRMTAPFSLSFGQPRARRVRRIRHRQRRCHGVSHSVRGWHQLARGARDRAGGQPMGPPVHWPPTLLARHEESPTTR